MIKYLAAAAAVSLLWGNAINAYAVEDSPAVSGSPGRLSKVGATILILAEQFDRGRSLRDRAEHLLGLKFQSDTGYGPPVLSVNDPAYYGVSYGIREHFPVIGDNGQSVESAGPVFQVYDSSATNSDSIYGHHYSQCLSQQEIVPQLLQIVGKMGHVILLERPHKASVEFLFTGVVPTESDAGQTSIAPADITSNAANGCMMVTTIY